MGVSPGSSADARFDTRGLVNGLYPVHSPSSASSLP